MHGGTVLSSAILTSSPCTDILHGDPSKDECRFACPIRSCTDRSHAPESLKEVRRVMGLLPGAEELLQWPFGPPSTLEPCFRQQGGMRRSGQQLGEFYEWFRLSDGAKGPGHCGHLRVGGTTLKSSEKENSSRRALLLLATPEDIPLLTSLVMWWESRLLLRAAQRNQLASATASSRPLQVCFATLRAVSYTSNRQGAAADPSRSSTDARCEQCYKSSLADASKAATQQKQTPSVLVVCSFRPVMRPVRRPGRSTWAVAPTLPHTLTPTHPSPITPPAPPAAAGGPTPARGCWHRSPRWQPRLAGQSPGSGSRRSSTDPRLGWWAPGRGPHQP